MQFQRFLAPAALLLLTTNLTGCSSMADAWENPTDYIPYFLQPYRADVHQGNLVTSEMVNQLEEGMTAAQVQFLLGVPLIRDQFHRYQWDYVYYLRRGNGEEQLRRLTVYFNDEDRVKSWTSDAMPDEEQADQLILVNIRNFAPKEDLPKGEAKKETSE